jgi:hypothetical protein
MFATVLSDHRWHHVGCARTGGFVSVMVDNVIVSRPVLLGDVTNTNPLAIGSKYGWEDWADAREDDVRLVISQAPADPYDQDIDVKRTIGQMRREPAVAVWHLDETEEGR